jgi:DNA-binding transcriptional LysR family regulator
MRRRAFFRAGRPLHRAIEEATNEAGASTAKVRGRLRVNVDPSTAQIVLTLRLALFAVNIV